MHPHQQLLESFYASFKELDGEQMAACYHPMVQFSDPVFTHLRGNEPGDMWKMLCSQAKNFKLTYGDIEADDKTGNAYWEARYDFSATGRRVHNKIHASFEFKDGLIIRHTDDFDFWKWSQMALGPVGLFLGWTPLIRNKVQGTAKKNLERFSAAQSK
ncbi:MAG: nuclear transport factor 2 family protein [Aliiglaciecola sp.]